MDRAVLWLARGGGLGLLPIAPGTWGSLGGIAWTALLLFPGNFGFFLGGALLGILLSAWACGRAAKVLKAADPGEIVLDEIIALPLCYLGVLIPLYLKGVDISLMALVQDDSAWAWAAAGFALFRLFDIWKPSPIRELQDLPGGWGITLDDVMAGAFTAVVLYCVWLIVGS
ncbi:MAG: phosphatidylglycerophosphatase A [Verrucomicrobiales bacterium]|nr:phosphatidylglycerophosphatase A [Verrucomicrobiales bacterium]|tara:strand:+ start:311 stop:823 length:513 start_codon:yes stop_codon:yes gene_type:complete